MPFSLFSRPSLESLISRKDEKGLTTWMLKTFPQAESQAALKALEDLGWQPGNDSAGAVAAILHDDFDRAAAIGDAAVIPLVNFLRDWNKKHASEAIQYGADEDGELAGAQTVYLESPWRRAQKALMQIGKAAVDPLIQLLLQENVSSLGAALEPVMSLLIEAGDPRAMEGFLHLLKQTPSSFEFWRLFRKAMQKFKDRRAIPYLRQAVQDKRLDSFIRGDARNILIDLGEK